MPDKFVFTIQSFQASLSLHAVVKLKHKHTHTHTHVQVEATLFQLWTTCDWQPRDQSLTQVLYRLYI